MPENQTIGRTYYTREDRENYFQTILFVYQMYRQDRKALSRLLDLATERTALKRATVAQRFRALCQA